MGELRRVLADILESDMQIAVLLGEESGSLGGKACAAHCELEQLFADRHLLERALQRNEVNRADKEAWSTNEVLRAIQEKELMKICYRQNHIWSLAKP